jgi:hypothetical protein
MVVSGSGRRAVRSLRVASRGTGRFTDDEVRELCSSDVTIGELLVALPHLTLPVSVRAAGFIDRQLTGKHGKVKTITESTGRLDAIVVAGLPPRTSTLAGVEIVDLDVATRVLTDIRDRAGPGERDVSLEVDPRCLLQVLARRLSCVKVDPTYLSTIRERARRSMLDPVGHALRRVFGTTLWYDDVRQILAGERGLPPTQLRLLGIEDDGTYVLSGAALSAVELWESVSWLTAEVTRRPRIDVPADWTNSPEHGAAILDALDVVVTALVERLRVLYTSL